MILSSYDSQQKLMWNLAKLYVPGGRFDADVTYGGGELHKGLLRPEFCFDLVPRFPFVVQADVTKKVPVTRRVKHVAFDPPFLVGAGGGSFMKKKYSSLPDIDSLFQMYSDALFEIRQVLEPNGILVFKCQDIINGRSQAFSHCEIYQLALDQGYYAADLFVLTTRNRARPHNMKVQHHARKSHCYFWVFKQCERSNHVA